MQSVAQPDPQRLLSPRVLSVDVLRGLTIALMILVNDPGDWSHVYSQLDHAPWNGFTLTDFVFPNFLFLVGVSTIFSLESRIARGNCKLTLTGHIFRRAATLFAIKLFLSAFPHFHLTHLRLYGVLTRIALCYLAVGLICLAIWNTRNRIRTLLTIAAALLIGYWALMRFVPVPGLGLASLRDAIPTHTFPILDPDRNLAAWLDRAVNAFTQRYLHTGSLYNRTRDPEGLLSTLPAIATTLIGCATGLCLRRPSNTGLHLRSAGITDLHLRRPGTTENACHSERSEEPPHFARTATNPEALLPTAAQSPGAPSMTVPPSWVGSTKARTLLRSALPCLSFGLLASLWFPLNKNLWTSSYVLFSAGLSLLLLALFYWLIDIRQLDQKPIGRALLFPWLVFGSNAITAFVLSNFIVELMLWIKVPDASSLKPISTWQWTYVHLFARHGSTNITSIAFALTFTAICFIPNWFLWRKRIFLKI
jgi:predicted acyltransferase